MLGFDALAKLPLAGSPTVGGGGGPTEYTRSVTMAMSLGLSSGRVAQRVRSATMPMTMGLSAAAVAQRVRSATLPMTMTFTAAPVAQRVRSATMPFVMGWSASAINEGAPPAEGGLTRRFYKMRRGR
jgi:hypothetical protein